MTYFGGPGSDAMPGGCPWIENLLRNIPFGQISR